MQLKCEYGLDRVDCTKRWDIVGRNGELFCKKKRMGKTNRLEQL